MPSDGKSKLELERYLAGELTPEQEEALRMRVGDDALRALVAQHASESEALFAELPPARFRAQVEARALPVRRGPRLMLAAPVLIAALTLLFWVRTPEGKVEHDPGAEQTRRKGLEPALFLFRKSEREVEALSPGAQVRAGDMLQVGYVAGGRRYGAIVSLDGAGTVTVHEPGPTLVAAGKQLLDRAYVLDAAPRFERFVLVTSEQPFELSTVVRALEQLPPHQAERAPLVLQPGMAQASFVVRKGGP